MLINIWLGAFTCPTRGAWINIETGDDWEEEVAPQVAKIKSAGDDPELGMFDVECDECPEFAQFLIAKYGESPDLAEVLAFLDLVEAVGVGVFLCYATHTGASYVQPDCADDIRDCVSGGSVEDMLRDTLQYDVDAALGDCGVPSFNYDWAAYARDQILSGYYRESEHDGQAYYYNCCS